MKKIYKAIDNAYSALDDCISKIVKSRLHKDKEAEERALYKLEIETNGVLQDLSYIKRKLRKRDWIKVEDRLPEVFLPKLCKIENIASTDYLVLSWTGSRWLQYECPLDQCGWYSLDKRVKVTHWQEIVPPKED